ncbi:hypothetical protein, partial [Klebsiella variicola]|uniref:hypothetical protein n=1 Tax=Klebsiella variicola TaxID=244366 RepID=UPI001955419A
YNIGALTGPSERSSPKQSKHTFRFVRLLALRFRCKSKALNVMIRSPYPIPPATTPQDQFEIDGFTGRIRGR